MKTDCIRPEDLARVLTLPERDAERQHLDHCLHCRAMAHAYAEFLDPDGVRPGFDLDAADRELVDRLDAILQTPRPAEASSPRAGPRGSWQPRVWQPKVWYAAAAVLLVCAGIFLARDAAFLQEARLPEGSGLARGEAEDATELAWSETEAGWRLTWRADTPGAPAAVFFDVDLQELARHPVAATGSTATVGELAPPPDAVYLQLIFEEDGDVVARSAMVAARPDGS